MSGPTKLETTKRVRRSPEALRAEALAAARQLILNREQTLTMRAVADAIGVTYPNLSHHFGSAAGLHAAIAEQMVSELLTGLREIASEVEDRTPNPRRLVDRVFDLFDTQGLGRVLGWLVQSGGAAQLDAVRDLLSVYIAEASAKHENAGEDVARVAMIVTMTAYAEASAGPLIGGVLGFDRDARRDLMARMVTPLMAHKNN